MGYGCFMLDLASTCDCDQEPREKLFLDLSETFESLPVFALDREIFKALSNIGALLDLDRVEVFEPLPNSRGFHPTQAWLSKASYPQARQMGKWIEENFDVVRKWAEETNESWWKGEVLAFNQLADASFPNPHLKAFFSRWHTKSSLSVPVKLGQQVVLVMAATTTRYCRTWTQEDIGFFKKIGKLLAEALVRKRTDEVRSVFRERMVRQDRQLQLDYNYLQGEVRRSYDHSNIVGQSAAMMAVLDLVKRVASSNTTVLIQGETGTGKELIAHALHQASLRQKRPLVQLNCAALPAGLIEAELFGHEKGAFTGAVARQAGRFEVANGATLFLDEIGELPIHLQPKLLRAIQTGEFEPLGGGKTLRSDIRIVAATNRDLEKEVAAGRFREDLWYRLNVFPITLPPLRDRREDIPLLVDWFAEKIGKKIGQPITSIPRETVTRCMAYEWPGNIRELENLVERGVIISRDGWLRIELPCAKPEGGPPVSRKLDDVEKAHITQILQETGWIIEGPQGAATILGLSPSTLRYRMRRAGIFRP